MQTRYRISAMQSRDVTTAPPGRGNLWIPSIAHRVRGVLVMVGAILTGVGCASNPAAVVPPSRPTTLAGISCTPWPAGALAEAGVEPPGASAEKGGAVVVQTIVHLMRADLDGGTFDEGNSGPLWRPSIVRDFFARDGRVNAIWKPTVILRLDRVEDCTYSPRGIRFDGRSRAAIFVPILEVPERGEVVEPETLSQQLHQPDSKSPVATVDRLATMAACLEALIAAPADQHDPSPPSLGPEIQCEEAQLAEERQRLDRIRRDVGTWTVDEWARIRALERLRDGIVGLGNIKEEVRALAQGLSGLSDWLGDKRQEILESLAMVVRDLDPIAQVLKGIRARVDAADGDQFKDVPDELTRSSAGLAGIATVLAEVAVDVGSVAQAQEALTLRKSLLPLRKDLRTIRKWGLEHGNRERQRVRQEADQLFRAVNRRFATVDPDALHVVIWWGINELATRLGFSPLGYGRAAARGGPALWVDRRCLIEPRDGCAAVLAHEVGHVFTLRHVCLAPTEPNVDGVPSCDAQCSVVEGCPVDPRVNLMHPQPTKRRTELEQCQRDQARREASGQFRR
jgi:hypothetical protein